MWPSALLVVAAMQPTQPIILRQQQVEVELTPRTPDQMASFNEARGFPAPMVAILKQHCYITIGIHNQGDTRVWLDLANWRFQAGEKRLEPVTRAQWKQRWQRMQIPPGKQATFRWTLIPETLDYLPGEEEGGNVILPFTDQWITLDAVMPTGEHQRGEPVRFHTEKLYCAQDAPEDEK